MSIPVKKIMSILLPLAMVISLLPAVTLPAGAISVGTKRVDVERGGTYDSLLLAAPVQWGDNLIVSWQDYATKIYHDSLVSRSGAVSELAIAPVTPHTNDGSDTLIYQELSNGNLLICWYSGSSGTGLTDTYFKIVNASGSDIVGPTKINSAAGELNRFTDFAELSNGDLAFIWATDGTNYALRRFHANGTPVDANQISLTDLAGTTGKSQYTHQIAANSNGSFMIIMACYDFFYRGMVFENAAPTPVQVGGQNAFLISDRGEYDNICYVKTLSNGNFLTVYRKIPSGQTVYNRSIVYQVFSPAGNSLAPERVMESLNAWGYIEKPIITEGGFYLAYGSIDLNVTPNVTEDFFKYIENTDYTGTNIISHLPIALPPMHDQYGTYFMFVDVDGNLSFAVNDSDNGGTNYDIYLLRSPVSVPKSTDASLVSVAEQSDSTPGAQSGADTANAITWEINVPNAKSALALADFIAAAGATKQLYSDASFTVEITGANILALTEGGTTTAYLKVTAEDTVTAKYYAVAISRAAGLPEVTTGMASSVTSTTAAVSGAVTSEHSSAVTEAGVVYSTDADTDSVIGGPSVTKVAGGLASGTITANLTGLAPGTTYYFRAYATNGVGTSYGSKDSFTTTAIIPGAPVIGTATAGNGQATVSFSVPASDGGAAITGYTVTSNPGGITATGASSPIKVNGLANGTAYTFTVTATNSAGTGAASAASNSVTPKGEQTITFSNPGAQNFGTSPTLTATASSGLTVAFTSDTPGVCSITPGGTLTFHSAGTATITASQAGNGTYLSATSVTQSFTVNAVVPGAPTIVTATAGDKQATVSFTAPAFTGGVAITGYTVTSNPGGFTATGASSPITVTGPTNGTAYTFTVTATNSAGTGPVSAVSNSVTPNSSPAVTSVAVPANARYRAGQNLNFTVNFDQNTIVSGTPQIAINVGETTVYADYYAGSGSTALVFRYAVAAGLTDSDGVSVGALTLNGGTIQNTVGTNATLTLNSVGSTSSIFVDSIVPTVSSVAVPADGSYKAGGNLAFMVNFSEAVTAKTAGGTPYLTLTVGSAERQAAYVSGSGTPALLFQCAVQPGDVDGDGISVGMLSLNGGTIQDAAGNDAVLALNSVGNTSGILVDTVIPTVTIASLSSAVTATDPIPVTITFSENVTGFTVGDITVGNGTASGFSGSGATYTVDIAPSGDGEVTVDVGAGVAQDAAGNGNMSAARLSRNYDATAPTVGGSGAITTSELTSSSVKLAWVKASDTVTAAASLQYKVVYSTSNNISTVRDALSNGTLAQDWAADLSAYTVTGLSANTDYYFDVLVRDAGGNVSAYTAAAARTTAVSSGSSGGNNGATVIVNGQSQTVGNATTGTNTSGQTVTTVTVDTGRLEKILASQGSGATVTIPIIGSSDVAAGTLTGAMVKSMEDKEATIVIQTASGSYALPASEINVEAVSRQLGTSVSLADINVTVSIAEPSAAMAQVVQSAAARGGYTVMAPAVDFTIACAYGSQTVSVSSFNAYVERTIAIPAGVDPAKITTGVVVDLDGTVHHMPTRVTLIDGKYYAVINSLTNSTYSVIWNPVEFSDVASHWAKDAINNMGSRMVVTGIGNHQYAPQRNMTRAEFAAIVVRALGLEPDTGVSGFSDVPSSQWHSGYVKTAAAYGIIKGFSDGSFRPNDEITREQAMTMLARAMKVTGLNTGLTGSSADELMAAFSDGSVVSGFAKDAVAACLKAGITSGTSVATLSPKSEITRAEVAVMVERLLQKSNLI